ncbi:MAG: hypothetical protein QM809_01975 [Gordonia sp. (in: high G+C Gram-positive bacteria)]|uniref:DUF6779 domain-containing protein n=1 Tax=Gordonia sp. (in: high G+C Gram-positive bacteria) TaxID=84139 RepID=UPI0039E729B6
MASTNSNTSNTRRAPRRRATKPAGPDESDKSDKRSAVRAAASSTGSTQVAQWLLGLFIVLAVIASLLMVFGDDISLTGSIAVVAALWAAVIGAILVTKYRRQADVAELRGRDQRDMYELQLEKEIFARRQYESEVENAIRHEVAEETSEEFEALKVQVLALRASLEELLGKPLPEVPPALRPERRRELGSGLSGVGYVPVTDDRVAADLDFEYTAPPADTGRHAPEPVEATGELEVEAPGDVEMTEIIPVVTGEEPAEREYAPEYHESDYYEVPAEVRPLTGSPDPADYTADDYDYPSGEYTEAPVPPAQQYGGRRRHDDGEQYTQQLPQYDDDPRYEEQPQAYDAAAYQPPAVPGRPAYTRPAPQPHQVPQVPEVPPMPQRGRRASTHDDGAHTDGLSVNDLLGRLNEGRGRRGGGRRRRD